MATLIKHPYISLHSRSHILDNFLTAKDRQLYIKRDDELSFGVSGSKCRKFLSLISHFINNEIKKVIVIGSAHSNNVLAAAQLLAEYKIEIIPFLLRPHNDLEQGNFRLSRLFFDPQKVFWVERKHWKNVNQLASDYAKTLNANYYVLHEGSATPEALIGAETIADDIIQNEQELGLNFNHIFMDAGTGFSAVACIKRLVELNHQAKFHIVMLADKEQAFRKRYIRYTNILSSVNLIQPRLAKSFGSVNSTLIQFMQSFAKDFGILLDPIYSAKLLYTGKQILLENDTLNGNILFIHSGNSLSLAHF